MRHPVTARRTLAALAVGAGLVGSPAAHAADPFGKSRPPVSDVVLARAALAAVDADPALRDVNLVVSVVDRVAVVGGPVPSAEHGRRAEDIIRRVNGVAEVKNRCFVQGGGGRPDPLIKAVVDRLGPAARPPAAGDLPGMVPPPRRSADGSAGPAATAVAAAPPAASVSGPVVVRKVAAAPVGPRPSFLLDPTADSEAAPAVAAHPSPRVTAAVPTSRPPDVADALTEVRRSDPRYARLTFAVDRGEVVIGGTAARAADAWDFADAARRVPGVRRVVVSR